MKKLLLTAAAALSITVAPATASEMKTYEFCFAEALMVYDIGMQRRAGVPRHEVRAFIVGGDFPKQTERYFLEITDIFYHEQGHIARPTMIAGLSVEACLKKRLGGR